MIAHLAATLLAIGSATGGRADSVPAVHTRVDTARHEIVITVSSIYIPAAETGGHHGAEVRVPVEWPVTGWLRGYRIDVLDSAGNLLPRELLHHAGVVNLDRRQLAYPVPERLIAAGSETKPVMLPASMGVPMSPQQRLLLFYMLSNHTANAVSGATLRVTITWTPEGRKGPRNVMPFIVDAFPQIGGDRSFDLPVGEMVTSSEFTLPVGGRLRAVGAHLHDYAKEIRLEDAETNKVLVRLKTNHDSTGHVTSVGSTNFIFTWGGLKLAANHRYRVVGVYNNTTCAMIPLGAMAVMVGVFIPQDMKQWPAVNVEDPLYAEDYAELLSVDKRMSRHMDDMNDMHMDHEMAPPAKTSCPAQR